MLCAVRQTNLKHVRELPSVRQKQEGITYNKTNEKEYNQVRLQKSRRKQKHTKYTNHSKTQIIPSQQMKLDLPNACSIGQCGMVSYEINLRAILSAYMIGTGGFDICRVMTMLGISGGSVFERQFYRCSNYIHDKIIQVCVKVVQDALDEEIMSCCGAKMNDNATNNIFETIDNNNANDEELTGTNRCTAAPIDVAFDMGWQKRAGECVCDSLSGHGFLIGKKGQGNKLCFFFKKMQQIPNHKQNTRTKYPSPLQRESSGVKWIDGKSIGVETRS